MREGMQAKGDCGGGGGIWRSTLHAAANSLLTMGGARAKARVMGRLEVAGPTVCGVLLDAGGRRQMITEAGSKAAPVPAVKKKGKTSSKAIIDGCGTGASFDGVAQHGTSGQQLAQLVSSSTQRPELCDALVQNGG